MVKKKASESAAAPVPTGEAVHWREEGERLALFRGCITVLARALSDKVVPVYLPATALLADLFSSDFLAPIRSSALPRAAIAHFANTLVFRSGSSNVRAREESSNALLHLARCESVGCATIAPYVTRPISNTRQAHAVIGRLELLRTLVAEFDLGSDSGLEISEVLTFALPLCEVASAAARDAAVGLVLDVRRIDERRVEAFMEAHRPAVLILIKARLAPSDTKPLSGLSVTGRKLPPIGVAPAGTGDDSPVTPAGHQVHARAARQTAMELGARGPPAAPKKLSKAETPSTTEGQPKVSKANDADAVSSSARTLSFENISDDEQLISDILESTK